MSMKNPEPTKNKEYDELCEELHVDIDNRPTIPVPGGPYITMCQFCGLHVEVCKNNHRNKPTPLEQAVKDYCDLVAGKKHVDVACNLTHK